MAHTSSCMALLIALWALVCHGLPAPQPQSPAMGFHVLRRDVADPGDLSWVKAWTSIGDSFSAGIGSGSKAGGWGDYFCSRYDASFPAIINADERLGSPDDHTFNNWACSGAIVDGVIDQAKALADGSQDFITVTAGGNDAFLTEILNNCVFQWNRNAFPFTDACGKSLDKAQKVIDSSDFHSKLDKLISTTKSKLKPANSHLYYLGYARFFGQDDNQCDSVTWSFLVNYGHRQYLTQDTRTKMNTLVTNMNKALSDAVGRAGSSVTFVDYDKYVAETQGRFCEDGHPETNGNRAGLLFYEWNTDDTKPATGDAAASTVSPPTAMTQTLVMNGTFEATIGQWIHETLAQDKSQAPDISISQTPAVSINDVKATKDQLARGYVTVPIPDSYGRIFHPRPNAHQLIANLLLYNVQANYAKQLEQTAAPETISSDTCPAPPAIDSHQCHGVSGDYWIMSRDVAVDSAKSFCAQSEKKVTYNKDSVNELSFEASDTSDASKGPKDDPKCLERIQGSLIDGCDGNDPVNNPQNYKFGSTLTASDGWKYVMTPLSKQINEVSCDVSYKFLWDSVEIRGKNLPMAKLGADGEGLKKQLSGCGALTKWNFEWTPDDVKFQWYATARLPIGTKACVGRALVSAGGADNGNCHGAGKRSDELRPYGIQDWPGYGEESKHVFRKPAEDDR